MPFLHLQLASQQLAPSLITQLQSGLTGLMAELLHKQATLTVVKVSCVAPEQWSVGGVAMDASAWSAQLDVYITADTNSPEDKSRFMARAHELIVAIFADAGAGVGAGPLYIVIHDIDAGSWGYNGQTQAARRLAASGLTQSAATGAASSLGPRTLKAIAGQPPARVPTGPDCTLLLIDFQHEYLDGRLPLPDIAQVTQAAARLVQAAEARGMHIIHIHHEATQADAPLFAPGSPAARALCALPVAPHHHHLVKRWPSSFKATGLIDLLASSGAKSVLLAGAMTHNCIDSTAREAMHLGLAVAIASDACATRDLPGIDGHVIPAEHVHICSLSALADRHADVFTTDQILQAWQHPAHQAARL
jgi:nicotinamidase-related amidase/phenylpyruvate tautomerase PptA (4-oxalocrotonate tautomerase family)